MLNRLKTEKYPKRMWDYIYLPPSFETRLRQYCFTHENNISRKRRRILRFHAVFVKAPQYDAQFEVDLSHGLRVEPVSVRGLVDHVKVPQLRSPAQKVRHDAFPQSADRSPRDAFDLVLPGRGGDVAEAVGENLRAIVRVVVPHLETQLRPAWIKRIKNTI